MKNLSIGLIIFFLISCGNKKENNESAQNRKTANEESVTVPPSRYLAQGTGNFLIDEATANSYKGIFEKKIRTPFFGFKNYKISQAIWFDSAAIKLLASYLENPTYKLDGVRMYLMAYDQMGRAEGQENENQLSLVIVPTLRGDTVRNVDGSIRYIKHKDDWKVLKTEVKNALSFLGGGINHGQLCPTACP